MWVINVEANLIVLGNDKSTKQVPMAKLRTINLI